MPSRSPEAALLHIFENISLCRQFIDGMTYDQFVDDRRTVYAVIRCLEIISEASRRLSEDIKSRHPEILWVDIAGAGNVYRHDYEDVREKILWQTANRGLTPLLAVVEFELGRLEN